MKTLVFMNVFMLLSVLLLVFYHCVGDFFYEDVL